MSESIVVSSTDGLKLEGVVDEARDGRGVLIFCHPHPKDGGTMNAPLLVAVTEALVGAGWNVVRFNFRGIGSSEGAPGDGTEEVADARGALAFARDRFAGTRIALTGWSFGASVALRTAPGEHDVVAVVAIAPSVEGRAGYSVGLPPIMDLHVPVLVISGANDKHTDPEPQREWAEENNARYVTLKGANHFFWGKYDDLAAAITSFLDDLPQQAQAST